MLLVVQVTGGSHFPSQQGLNLKLPVNSESAFKLSFNLKILSSFLAPGPSHFTRDIVCERELQVERDSDKLEDNRKNERDSERLELQQYFILSNAYKLSDARPSAGAATALALVRARLLLLLRRSPSEASHSGSLRPGSGWQVQVHLELAYY
jgi:hypothetical protein